MTSNKELLERTRQFEKECADRYRAETDESKLRWHILGMSDAIMEQAILAEEE